MKGDEFIREVDEAVRQERWLKLWHRYGTYLIAAAVAVVLGTGAGLGWRTYQESRQLDRAERFAAAVELQEAGRHADAAAAFESLASDAGGDYAVLARLRAAAAHAAAGNEQARQEMLREISAEADAEVFRDLGQLLVARQELEPAALDGLAGSDEPWRHSALELKALAEIRAGDTDAARATLTTLVGDPATPANLNRRASELLAALGGPLPGAGEEDTGENG